MGSSDKVKKIISLLDAKYPNAKIILKYSNNWELLVAVMLSAQCTDMMVNKVTSALFKKYKTIQDYARVKLTQLEQDIRSTGFYRNKAKNIQASAKLIIKEYKNSIPNSMEELLKIPGVARKTANVVLGNAYGISEGIAVDTHVTRLSHRLGLTTHHNPTRIEKDLMDIVDKKYWIKFTYLLIEHGRAICQAKKPKCNECILSSLCPSAFKFPHFNALDKR